MARAVIQTGAVIQNTALNEGPCNTASVSFRLASALIDRVDAWAAEHRVNRTTAVAALIEQGLTGRIARTTSPPRARNVTVGPSTIRVDAPLAGTFATRPYQKGQLKKGKTAPP